MKAVLTILWLTIASCVLSSVAAAEPLYLQTPYDEIKLDETNGNALLKVKPLDLLERKLPALLNRKGDLEVELLERPGEKFALAWANIVDVKLFEDRVLAEAEQQAIAGKFDEAQASFRFLEQKHPQLPRLNEAIENYLWLQIGGSFRAGRHDETLALLVELQRRNPKRTGLSTAYERTTIELVKSRLAAKNYRGARGLLATFAKRFPETGPAVIAPYHAQLQDEAKQLVTQAQTAAGEEKWSAANALCLQALEVWPTIEGGSALSQQIHASYPAVTVGVIGSPTVVAAGSPSSNQTRSDWNIRRLNRLLATPLVELVDSDKGPVYRSPYGKLVPLADARQFVLRLSSPAGASAADQARQLKPTGDAATAITGIRARGLTDVLFEFQHPQLRAPAWMQLSLQDSSATGNEATPTAWGQFVLEQTATDRGTLRRRTEVTAATTAPQLVHERKFADATLAIAALRRGQINVLDRIPPWELARTRAINEVRVLPYAIPTVHLLIPNASRPLTANRTFRRALLYALDREAILKQGLLADQAVPGCEVISGPFPKGPDRLPWSYACNTDLKPRGYDPSLAGLLLEIARTEVAGGQPPAVVAPLTLAHDDQPTTKIACLSIARQLARIGQPINLQQVAAGQGTNADLQYVELALYEPLVDAWALLGPNGLSGGCSPLMLEHFRSLETAADWPAATARLHAIHRLTNTELPVIPLWQTTNFLACHASLQGLAERPVSLYEDVLNWQIAWRAPQE